MENLPIVVFVVATAFATQALDSGLGKSEQPG